MILFVAQSLPRLIQRGELRATGEELYAAKEIDLLEWATQSHYPLHHTYVANRSRKLMEIDGN